MAGFSTAVTGLKASTTMLDVAGNNIANSSTVGFKASRTEFGDIYSTAVVGAGSSNTPGSGVTVTDIAQDFSAGTIEFTNNNLDLAINGSGFFKLDDGQGGVTYTRSGAFELDKEGNIVSKTGKFLQGYGLDADGNRLPVENMKVTEKESPPKATENIDLSFNIDSREDAGGLLPVYNKDEPGSFTYTTTDRTFDSLGNEHTIKYNFAEQRPVRQVYDYALDPAAGYPTISGVTLVAGDFDAATGALIDNSPTTTGYDDLALADDRIDLSTLNYDAATGRLSFELKSWASDLGDLVVRDGALAEATQINTDVDDMYRDANETRTYNISINGDKSTELGVDGSIEIAGVSIPISSTDNAEEIVTAIKNREAQILDRNPEVESIAIDTSGTVPTFTIRFKADEGNVDDSANNFIPKISTDAAIPAASGDLVIGDQTINNASGQVTDQAIGFDSVVQGDNSYQGNYRMYAYLNNEELLDIGKLQDPGEGLESEPGPILISFNPSNGLLQSINGEDFPAGGQVPSITISGADPANELTEISLDLAGTTQFASASIVKASQQDGYTKGDLIGVTFAGTGEMIASYSNGENQSLGVVALATFENQDGLQPSGDTEWIATLDSGAAIVNPPGTGLNGTLRSAALEASNVDLSEELVKLIEGQRNYQANSKTLETMNTITQAILQI
ncbi:flagellar hook protein FlgE [Marinobacterium stanieri]|uniref:Flagellar hook protein FlgE n=1 Tax=Marinobacterium stanieri TaxID=49186 RepID=A0A1N6X2V2_9GAMM|nr:flagellar hook-basal body complex protein [Marinobacterium stanieri]SIQ96682.1 flagellar hook protein FlgE [Marinobacterium stanieri]